MTAAFIFSHQDDFYGTSDRREARERLERLAWAMDSAIRVPGTNFTVGADAMLGLIPGIGNLATTAISGYLIREAWRLGVPRATIVRMVGNVATDSLISAIPIVGNFTDVFWKANRKNMAILAEHLDSARIPGSGASDYAPTASSASSTARTW